MVAARKLRAKRLEQHGRGEAGRAAERIRVRELLAGYQTDAEVNRRASLPTIVGHIKMLNDAVGHLRAIDCTTDRVQMVQRAWQGAGVANSTINRRLASLRRAFVLAVRAGKLYVVPYIPRLAEHGRRGRYLSPADADAIETQLPDYVRPTFRFAIMYGTRKGQLARTLRRYVDLERQVVEWPASECKKREAHVIRLDEDGLVLVQQCMDDARTWCPYLFHGLDCAPGRAPSKVYGCIGDFKKITGHETAHVFRHYDLGDVNVLRERLARSREYVRTLRANATPKVTPLRPAATAAEHRVAG